MNAKEIWALQSAIQSLEDRVSILEAEIKRKADKPGRKPNIEQDTK